MTRDDPADGEQSRGTHSAHHTRINVRFFIEAERVPVLDRYVEPSDEYHAVLVTLAKSDALVRASANAVSLPFASAGALLASQATLSREHEIRLVARDQHRMLLVAVGADGARAKESAREHARLAKLDLDHVLESEHALERLPGAPLLRGVV